MAYLAEREFIERLKRNAGARRGAIRVGIGDDCAVLRPPRRSEVVVTTDFTLEGVHFRRDWHGAELVGRRCLTRGLSDLAAMGAKPMAAFLSLAVARGDISGKGGKASWADCFLDGLMALAKECKVPLAGGDLAESPGPLMIADIVLSGSVPRGRALLRSGARKGDGVYVTGALGGAAAELELLRRDGGTAKHMPEPRVAVGQALLRRGLATACIDLSDGLSTDLDHLCEESGVGAEVDAATLPVHPRAAAGEDGLRLALHGGEDYELLFTAAASARVPRKIAGVDITRIGRVTVRKGEGRVWLMEGGKTRALEVGGWEHFSGS